MKTYLSIIALYLCFTTKAEVPQLDKNILLGTWTYIDNETEKEDDCFTVYRFEFQSNNKCSHWNDIGYISTKKTTMARLIFKGTFAYNPASKEIIIHMEGNRNAFLKIKVLAITPTSLSLQDEEGNRMNLIKIRN